MPAKVSKAGKYVNASAYNVDLLPSSTFDISGDEVAVTAHFYSEIGQSGIIDARNCTVLRDVKAGGSWITSVLVTGSTQMRSLIVESASQLTGIVTTGLVNLTTLVISECALTTFDIGALVNLTYVKFSDNELTESAVDNILADLDAAGLEDGEVDLSGGTNAIPSAAGLTSKSNLEGKGWTVSVNEA